MLAEYRRFVAGEGGFSLRRWAALYRHGFRSAALDRWLGARTDHFTEYRDGCRARSGFAQHPGGREMQAAAQEAAELGATVEWIDAPAEISSARAWNQKDIVSNMWRTAVRWHRTVPKATCPDTWKDTPPQGWDEFRVSSEALTASYDVRQAADRQRLALDVGGGGGGGGTAKGGAAQVFEGADLRVWLYERDLILADNLHRVAAQLAGPGGRRQRRKGAVGAKHDRTVVGVLGLARKQQTMLPLRRSNPTSLSDFAARRRTRRGCQLGPPDRLPAPPRRAAASQVRVAVAEAGAACCRDGGCNSDDSSRE